MKRLKLYGFLLVFTLAACFTANAQNASFKTWKITSTQSGGFAGINKVNTLDGDGFLTQTSKGRGVSTEIDAAKLAEIVKLLKGLKLPATKQKTVKGRRIYDGIYTGLVITLDGKDYKIEGSSFGDEKRLALSKKQKAALEKLKAKLKEFDGFFFT
jgi:hypothetical protein